MKEYKTLKESVDNDKTKEDISFKEKNNKVK